MPKQYTYKGLESNMKVWVLKDKNNAYLCRGEENSYELLFAENGYINGNIVLAEKKKYLSEILEWFNTDILPKYKVKPVQVEVLFKVTEIKKENKNDKPKN